MNTKKILAVLIAGVCAGPMLANADETKVTIYGNLFPEFNFISTSGATPVNGPRNTLSGAPTGIEVPRHNEVQASNSRIGFRGSEKLPGGYEAFFQIESAVAIDGGAGEWAARDSWVGIKGGFGSLKLGKFDTVYKEYGDRLSFLGVSSGNFVSNSNVLSKAGFGTSSSSSFHIRRENSIQYDSPELGEFEFAIMYSPDEAKTASRNANVVSMGVQYGGGKDDPLLLAIGYEVHNDLFGASRNIPAALSNTANLGARAKDTALRFTAAYNFGKSTSVEFNYATMEYKESGGLAGRFQNYKHGAYSLSLLHRVKSWQFAASMSRANAGTCSLVGGVACTTDGLDGRQVSIGTSYNFSRRASVFVIFSKLTNGYAASYENLDLYRASSGSDISQFAIGMQHRF